MVGYHAHTSRGHVVVLRGSQHSHGQYGRGAGFRRFPQRTLHILNTAWGDRLGSGSHGRFGTTTRDRIGPGDEELIRSGSRRPSVFAAFCVLYNGIALLTRIAVLMVPLHHRFLHKFRRELSEKDDEDTIQKARHRFARDCRFRLTQTAKSGSPIMEHPEVPLEQSQEEIAHHAHHATEKWILGVALTAALLAVLAAITALLAEHQANEAMLDQIRSSDKWAFYQAKSIKANLFTTKIELLKGAGQDRRRERPGQSRDLPEGAGDGQGRGRGEGTGVRGALASTFDPVSERHAVPGGHCRRGDLGLDQTEELLVCVLGFRRGRRGAAFVGDSGWVVGSVPDPVAAHACHGVSPAQPVFKWPDRPPRRCGCGPRFPDW